MTLRVQYVVFAKIAHFRRSLKTFANLFAYVFAHLLFSSARPIVFDGDTRGRSVDAFFFGAGRKPGFAAAADLVVLAVSRAEDLFADAEVPPHQPHQFMELDILIFWTAFRHVFFKCSDYHFHLLLLPVSYLYTICLSSDFREFRHLTSNIREEALKEYLTH